MPRGRSTSSSSEGSGSKSRSSSRTSSSSRSRSPGSTHTSKSAATPRAGQKTPKTKPPDSAKSDVSSRSDASKKSSQNDNKNLRNGLNSEDQHTNDNDSDIFASRSDLAEKSDTKNLKKETPRSARSSASSRSTSDHLGTPSASVITRDEKVGFKSSLLSVRSGKENDPVNTSTPRKQFIVPTDGAYKQATAAEKVKQYLVQLPKPSKPPLSAVTLRLSNGVQRSMNGLRGPSNGLPRKSPPKAGTRVHAWQQKPPGYQPGTYARTNMVGRLGPQTRSSPVRTPLVHAAQPTPKPTKPVVRKWKAKSAANPPPKRSEPAPAKPEEKPALKSNSRTSRSTLFSRAHYPQHMHYKQTTSNKLLIESRVPRCLQQFPRYTNQPLRQNCLYNPWGSVSFSNKHLVRSGNLPHPRDAKRDRPSSAPPQMQSSGTSSLNFTKPEIAQSFTIIPQDDADSEDSLNNNAAYHYTYEGGRDTPVVYEDDEDHEEPPQDLAALQAVDGLDDRVKDDDENTLKGSADGSESERGDNSDEEEDEIEDEMPTSATRPKSAFPPRRPSVVEKDYGSDDEVPEDDASIDSLPVDKKQSKAPTYDPDEEADAEEIEDES